MGKRVVLHVGCPKTGTTGIQHQLLKNPIALALQGWVYPSGKPHQHFLAVVDLLDLPWGAEIREEAAGAWDEFVGEVRSYDFDVIISHELLARASAEHVERIVASFAGADISVVITARDLGRIVPAEYQEHLKHRSVMRYRTFLDRLRDPEVDDLAGRHARLTRSVQDVPAIADRWAKVLGTDKVTIVTVPPNGAPRDQLLQRFGEAVGLDATRLRHVEDLVENHSLGVLEVELLRRLNERYNDELDDRSYGGFARTRMVRSPRVSGADKLPLVVPVTDYPWVRAMSQERILALRSANYPVVGDLDELLPVEPQVQETMPEGLDDALMFDIALRELANGILDFEEVIEELEAPRERLVSQMVRRSKERIVVEAAKRPLGQRALSAWEDRHWISRST